MVIEEEIHAVNKKSEESRKRTPQIHAPPQYSLSSLDIVLRPATIQQHTSLSAKWHRPAPALWSVTNSNFR